MARFVGASTRCAPWGLWIWFKDGRNHETRLAERSIKEIAGVLSCACTPSRKTAAR